ncbi:hypothetical protein R3P38DRAFT_2860088, partial [Favolaschia claudopus]
RCRGRDSCVASTSLSSCLLPLLLASSTNLTDSKNDSPSTIMHSKTPPLRRAIRSSTRHTKLAETSGGNKRDEPSRVKGIGGGMLMVM